MDHDFIKKIYYYNKNLEEYIRIKLLDYQQKKKNEILKENNIIQTTITKILNKDPYNENKI